MKTDFQIQNDVKAQIRWESVLHSSEIVVAVNDGVVTLSGIVDTYTKKVEAEKAAKKVGGVKAVAIEIQVDVSPIFKKKDSEITETVFKILKTHTILTDHRIKITVENGGVTLEGDVDWDHQRKAAQKAIEHVPGVRDVFNLITVRPKEMAKDIEHKISDAFIRHATIESENIIVEMIGSKVILKGTVRSLIEMEDAEDAVWQAPGVTAVDNRLLIEEELPVF